MLVPVQTMKEHLRAKTFGYWLRAMIVGCLGFWLNVQFSDLYQPWLINIRMDLYSHLNTSKRLPQPANAAVVLLSDRDFWLGPLAQRSPVKRDYLGAIVTKLCESGARTIALDFIFRSPTVDRSTPDNPAYLPESVALVSAIRDAASKGCRVVLPITLNCADQSRQCTKEAGIFDDVNFNSPLVTRGAINLPNDTRRMFTQAELRDGTSVDSFAEAIVRAQNPRRLPSNERAKHEFPFVTFMTDDQFRKEDSVLQSDWVMSASDSDIRDRVQGDVVLIGAGWHSKAFGYGDYVDQHRSPVGMMTGVFLHLNYIAAALDGRLVPAVPEGAALVLDAIFLVLVALGFAAFGRFRSRWIFAGILLLLLALIQYVAWENFGMFIDCTLPILLLAGHCMWDEHSHMRRELTELRRFKTTTEEKKDAHKSEEKRQEAEATGG
jgi:hypothetical protein